MISRMTAIFGGARWNDPTQVAFDQARCECGHERQQHANYVWHCESGGCDCRMMREARG